MDSSCRNQVLKQIDKEKKKGKRNWSEGKSSPAAAPFFFRAFCSFKDFAALVCSMGFNECLGQRVEVVPRT